MASITRQKKSLGMSGFSLPGVGGSIEPPKTGAGGGGGFGKRAQTPFSLKKRLGSTGAILILREPFLIGAFERQISQDEALYKCRLLRGASSGDQQDGPLYKCCLLRSEDPAFGAKPRPECSGYFFLGRTHCVLSSFLVSLSHALLRGPLSWGQGLTIHALLRGPLSWGRGLKIHAS